MNWQLIQLPKPHLLSDDQRYKITNFGTIKGEDKYCLYQYDQDYKCHCNLVTIGTLDRCKEAAHD